MDRIALDYLTNWIKNKDKKPLIVRGARQVGKSYLVREFAKRQGLELLETNFENESEIGTFFDNPISKIIQLLELQYKTKIHSKTLLFFDEIQAAPNVIPKLRYFYEERPDLSVIAAGSLLEFVLSDHSFSMPVGRVEYLHLGPMMFEEFLIASGESHLKQFLDEFKLKDSIPLPLHQKLMEFAKIYSLVGGMPASIQGYLKSSWEGCESVKQNILSTYEDDFSKYKTRVSHLRLKKVFRKIPLLIGEKVKYVHIDREEKSRNLSEALDLLEMAQVCYRVCHSSANGVPLGAEVQERIFKPLFLDVGLMSSLCGLSLLDLEKEQDLQLVNQGKITDQWIGQHLLYSSPFYKRPELHYWVREKRNSSAEIDYLISSGAKVIPIEVKSGKTGRLKSLNLFLQEKRYGLGVRFNTDFPSLFKAENQTLVSLPIYLVGQLSRILRISKD